MGITIAVTRVACAVGTAPYTQDITTTDLGGLTPKAALFIVSYATADGTAADNAVICVGATTGATQRASAYALARHGGLTSATAGASISSNCISIYTAASSTVGGGGVANFNAFIENGVQINWTAAAAAGYLLTVVLFAGTELSATAGSTTLGNVLDAALDVTTVGFQPDAVLFFSGISGDRFALGMAQNVGGVVTQRAHFGASANSSADSSDVIYARDDACFTMPDSGGGTIYWLEASAFDSQGFTVTARNAGAQTHSLRWLALAFGGAATPWIGTHTTPTTTGSLIDSGPGFTPQFLLQIPTLAEAAATVYSDARAGSWGIAVADADEAYVTSHTKEDAAAMMNTQSLSDDQWVNLPAGTGSALFAGTLTALTASGWTTNYSAVDSVAKVWYTLAIGAGSAAQSINVSDSIVSAEAVYSPTITVGPVTVTASRIEAQAVVNGPTVTVGAVTLAATIIEATSTVYMPTVTVGAVSVAPNIVASASVVYAVIVSVFTAQTSPARTLTVAAEVRAWVIAAEVRAWVIAAESRTTVIR